MASEKKSRQLALIEFQDAMATTNTEKSLIKCRLDCMTLKIMRTLILKRMLMMPKGGHGSPAMLSSVNQP